MGARRYHDIKKYLLGLKMHELKRKTRIFARGKPTGKTIYPETPWELTEDAYRFYLDNEMRDERIGNTPRGTFEWALIDFLAAYELLVLPRLKEVKKAISSPVAPVDNSSIAG